MNMQPDARAPQIFPSPGAPGEGKGGGFAKVCSLDPTSTPARARSAGGGSKLTARIAILFILCAAPAHLLAQDAAPIEKFVAADARQGVMLELRSEVSIHGRQVTLKQVCRWSDVDGAFFAPMADLVVATCSPQAAFQSVSLQQLKKTLADAGVNLAVIRFAGPTACTIARNDVHVDQDAALRQWIDASAGISHAKEPMPTTAPAEDDAIPATAVATKIPSAQARTEQAIQTLRDILTADASQRFNLSGDALQLTFSPADEKVLALSGPQFKFNIDARRLYNLGDISWDIRVITDGGSKRVTVGANARAWQTQVVVNKPLAYKQVLRDADLTERRTLVDHLPDEPLATVAQSVGQQAAQDLKPGMVLTARMIDPVQLVKVGQLVGITLNQGGVKIDTVMRAMENGSYGQTVRVKNEASGQTYEAVITGSQEATLSPTRTAEK
jgi:flagellar basal body P-ring formation protein FlgA